MSRVALVGENSIKYISTLIDIWNNGDCAVLIDCKIPFLSAVQMMQEARVKKCYIQEGLWNESLSNCPKIEFVHYAIENNRVFSLQDCIYDGYQPNYSNEEAVIIFSSGTTGNSKGIVLSHFAISTNADAIIDYMKPSAKQDCIFITRYLSHSSTLTGELLVALKSRIRMIVVASAVPPRILLSAVSKFDVTIMCLNPVLLSLLCDEMMRKAYNISSLKRIYVSGAILNDSIYKKAQSVLTSISVFNVYGLSEAAPRVAAQTEECCKSNSVGKPIRGVEVAIVDENGATVFAGVRGVIHVKTPSLFSGYVTGQEKHFSMYQGWLNTGDIGYWDSFGELHIVDRLDDVIVCYAHKVYPADVERLILENSLITDCAVSRYIVNDLEEIGCLYVSEKDCAMDIVRCVQARLAKYEIPKSFLRVKEIPRNNRGKINRRAVANILSMTIKNKKEEKNDG